MEEVYQKKKKSLWGLKINILYKISLVLLINLIPFNSFSQVRHEIDDNSIVYIEIPIISFCDTSIFQVLDWVLEHDSNNPHFTTNVSYSIRIYYDKDAKSNIIKIEGSDLDRLFKESKDLLGYFRYNNHTFFLLENCDKFFTVTKQYEEMKINKDQEIMDDDRFEIYFFGYNNDQFYRLIL